MKGATHRPGHTRPAQERRSAWPQLPWEILAMCRWAHSRDPGGCEWRRWDTQPPISRCGHWAGQRGSPRRGQGQTTWGKRLTLPPWEGPWCEPHTGSEGPRRGTRAPGPGCRPKGTGFLSLPGSVGRPGVWGVALRHCRQRGLLPGCPACPPRVQGLAVGHPWQTRVRVLVEKAWAGRGGVTVSHPGCRCRVSSGTRWEGAVALSLCRQGD